ncbi:heparinase II/III family protein [Reichenbachiella carrageenanivorans]|uniref:Heparinase II/III family protein n=1 Tax=Reichenbachiella carrageenanivorans TaxID=2979869 RepID=A0ABY6CWI2_9BACT|nr:heparinase II/III family protein [Reichenbachiella carrageenanivorans]UXX78265.1 heparinase II/III family protein [Reichenbachiella carrageenanivorans]
MSIRFSYISLGFSVAVALMLLSCVGHEGNEGQQRLTDPTAHPQLTLTLQGVEQIKTSLGQVPLFDQTLSDVIAEVDAELANGIEVPVPKDLAGGYTHERHKSNFFIMQKAGTLFQITGDDKYAVYLRDMLLAYAELWPTIGKHPAERSYARGKLFWQCLNDANWLVYTSQGYDCIYDWLDVPTREKLNKELFRPYAEYVSVENPQFFNRIHNHSTWGNAAVGMIGLVMDDEELINWSLYGLDIEVPGDIVKDNDGGDIKLEGQKEAGFLAQIDHSFSPDGYYTEGPYYQRYAMYPFLIFAEGLANKKPELKILDYRDGLLIKAINTLINQTNSAGEFFPINDSQKGMSLASRELVSAVSIAYYYGGNDPGLLSIVEDQGRVPLNNAGLASAKAVAEGKAKKYQYKSMELADGAAGDEGAIGILRADDLTLVMKYAKHGMGHGHFDRLGFLLYDETGEVIQDYGAARWVNVEHKDGGGYLKENRSWAKETVAHNTLVVDKDSHFDGNVKKADQTAGMPYYFLSGDDVQIVSAKEQNAYPGIDLQRTMAVVRIEELESPLVIDLFSVQAPEGSRYDLPLYYVGEFMSSNQKFQTNNVLSPMGKESGYQHLWAEAQTTLEGDVFSMTWFNKKKFYTVTSVVELGDEMILTRIGANDPNFNLRRDPGLIHRRTGGNTVFASLYEIHGSYDYASERPLNSFTSVATMKILHQSEAYVVVQFQLKTGERYQFACSLLNDSKTAKHTVEDANGQWQWQGIYNLKKNI